MKGATYYFDKTIPVNQLALADFIFRTGFPLQNFKKAFIQERPEGCSNVGPPCVVEIRWYGRTDEGLVDVHPMVDLWGNDSEVKPYRESRLLLSNATLTTTEIAGLGF